MVSPLDAGRQSQTMLRRGIYLRLNEAMIGIASPAS